MATTSLPPTSSQSYGSPRTYIIGFLISLVLTISAYISVDRQLFSGTALVAVIVTLAILQLATQLFFFLHVGREGRPRWNLTAFLFMLLVVGIIVIGSLWIMHNLDYHMSGHDMDTYIIEDEGVSE